jgi:hypothetical protein
MRTFTPPAHRSRRRALADQLAPAALRTRPYRHPIAEPDLTDEPDELGPAAPRRLRRT